MQFEDAYIEERNVNCKECDFDGTVEISIVAYATVEVGEWECPSCNAVREYSNDTIWDMADLAYDKMKEGW
jgi:hypothetical protein